MTTQSNAPLLTTYAFTEEDIDLITLSLRRFKDSTGLGGLKEDAENLLSYIERLKKEKKEEAAADKIANKF